MNSSAAQPQQGLKAKRSVKGTVLYEIIQFVYKDGSQRFLVSGDGFGLADTYPTYEDALAALKAKRAAKEAFKRLSETRESSRYVEDNTEVLPEGFTIFVLKIYGNFLSAIVVGPHGYLVRDKSIAKLARLAWDKVTENKTSKSDSRDPSGKK